MKFLEIILNLFNKKRIVVNIPVKPLNTSVKPMKQIIKEVNGKDGTRSTFPDITNEFTQITNWNTYTRNDVLKSDNGTRYKHMGVVNSVILLQRLAEKNEYKSE